MICLYLCLIFTESGLLHVYYSRGPQVALIEKLLVGQETRRGTERLFCQPKNQPHLKLTARENVSLLASDMDIKGGREQKRGCVQEEEYKRVKLNYLFCPTLKLECIPFPSSPLCLRDHKEQPPIPTK